MASHYFARARTHEATINIYTQLTIINTMKRFLALAALLLGLVACQTEPEGLDVNVGGAVDTTITVSIPETETRAGGTNSA